MKQCIHRPPYYGRYRSIRFADGDFYCVKCGKKLRYRSVKRVILHDVLMLSILIVYALIIMLVPKLIYPENVGTYKAISIPVATVVAFALCALVDIKVNVWKDEDYENEDGVLEEMHIEEMIDKSYDRRDELDYFTRRGS